MKKRIVVVGAVLVRNGDVLCAQRSQDMTLPGMWEFPGGKLELGESAQQALVRELDEELAIEAEIGERVDETEYEYDFGVVNLTTYWGNIISGEPQAREHAELRWLPIAELAQLDWAPADIPAVEKIIKAAG
ncbi:(deoxy)nucleoside triphosphate pyrophosphohydrolase [Brevibacterium yomogidense]|uniref:(deoxy)nucleoside triphosphate pyrophosphohydrolase n=1 Tax=Brevibacterium yomogidense TaxID=946573 RepID=UPI000B35C59F|nr:(deoxy)nucleoside triphosphate pyrophosphohydrolase [Brevibacterium yomogidense]